MGEFAPAIVPIFLLIGLGYVLKRMAFADERFWAGADRITYYIFLPALLCRGLATADLKGLPLREAAIVAAVAVLATVALLHLLRRPLALGEAPFTSVVQGAIRPNTYVALAAVLAIYGEEGLGPAALAVVAFIPLVNFISIVTLLRFGKGAAARRGGPGNLARQVLFNPLILACAAGLVINGFDRGLAGWLDTALDLLGRAALPVGLIAVGAGFAFAGIRRMRGAILVATLAKFGLLPAIALGALHLLKVGATDAGVLMLFAAAPVSVSAYILARQMGGDHKLMAAIVTVQTLLAIAAVPAWMAIAQAAL